MTFVTFVMSLSGMQNIFLCFFQNFPNVPQMPQTTNVSHFSQFYLPHYSVADMTLLFQTTVTTDFQSNPKVHSAHSQMHLTKF